MKQKVGIFVCGLIAGLIIVTQANVTQGEHAFVSAKILSDNEIIIQSEMDEMEKIKILIEESEQKLLDYQSEYSSSDQITQQVNSEYAQAKMMAGYEEVKGEGISILLEDSTNNLLPGQSINDIIVHDLDILIIIEDLIGAGAEAISINGERYVGTTEISCSGHTVKINGKKYAVPFYINAIGDSAELQAAMSVPGSYGSILPDYGLIFKVSKKTEIVIPAYKERINPVYMTAVEDGGSR